MLSSKEPAQDLSQILSGFVMAYHLNTEVTTIEGAYPLPRLEWHTANMQSQSQSLILHLSHKYRPHNSFVQLWVSMSPICENSATQFDTLTMTYVEFSNRLVTNSSFSAFICLHDFYFAVKLTPFRAFSTIDRRGPEDCHRNKLRFLPRNRPRSCCLYKLFFLHYSSGMIRFFR